MATLIKIQGMAEGFMGWSLSITPSERVSYSWKTDSTEVTAILHSRALGGGFSTLETMSVLLVRGEVHSEVEAVAVIKEHALTTYGIEIQD
jgi:hypothetical protein